ncbi:hypothetical protein QJQ45_021955 [Haematococcus lacustris]|nr:hypothetical protein QJQ45_021955 [Haematococcus lacustris]
MRCTLRAAGNTLVIDSRHPGTAQLALATERLDQGCTSITVSDLLPGVLASLRQPGNLQFIAAKHSPTDRYLLSPMRCMFSAALQSLSTHLPGCDAGFTSAALPWALPVPLLVWVPRRHGTSVVGPPHAACVGAPAPAPPDTEYVGVLNPDPLYKEIALAAKQQLDSMNAPQRATRQAAASPRNRAPGRGAAAAAATGGAGGRGTNSRARARGRGGAQAESEGEAAARGGAGADLGGSDSDDVTELTEEEIRQEQARQDALRFRDPNEEANMPDFVDFLLLLYYFPYKASWRLGRRLAGLQGVL